MTGGALLAALLAVAPAPVPAAGTPLTPQDLLALHRVSDPQVSPDGRVLVFVQADTDLAANRNRTSLWFLALGAVGDVPRRITDASGNDSSPRWADGGHTLYFLSTRSGSSQVWRLRLGTGSAQRITDYPLDVIAYRVSPRGDLLAVAMDTLPGCTTPQCTRAGLDARAQGKSSGRLYDRVFVRHWDTWADGTRAHLYTAPLPAEGKAGEPTDVMHGLDADVPGKPFGGDDDFVFSPDGRTLVFCARLGGHDEPWSTNFDLYTVPVDGSAAPVNLTAGNQAWDAQPVFLPNGDLAWRAQDRPGFESDRFHVMLRSARSGAVRALTGGWDRSVDRLAAMPGGRSLIATVDELGQRVLYRIDLPDGTPTRLTALGHVEDFSPGTDTVYFARGDLGAPVDVYSIPSKGGAERRLTAVNAELLAGKQLAAYEQLTFRGWHDETVHAYLMRPAGFAPGGHYPLAFVVHGGPQVSMQNLWTYRWNAQVLAGAGYAVLMVDFHGSPGYGQAFTDSISRDWGGKPLEDLQKGLAAALGRYPWLDGGRVCALGASYGGFMMNWIEGNWPDRFRCIVNHSGLFDQRTMYYSTEELWFPEWEFGGPYYERAADYERFNPAAFVANWHTPMLVIHGEKDFRIPYPQGIAAFTALQRRGIDSRLLVFPDENHWILRPANSLMWYQTVLDWLGKYLKN